MLVSSVTVVTREDCCGDLFRNVEVRAGVEPVPEQFSNRRLEVNTVCGYFSGPGQTGARHEIGCQAGITANYVTIQKLEKGELHVRDVEINGQSQGRH